MSDDSHTDRKAGVRYCDQCQQPIDDNTNEGWHHQYGGLNFHDVCPVESAQLPKDNQIDVYANIQQIMKDWHATTRPSNEVQLYLRKELDEATDSILAALATAIRQAMPENRWTDLPEVKLQKAAFQQAIDQFVEALRGMGLNI